MKFFLVTGCPRSGTTAVATWLGSGEGVDGVAESRRTIAGHAMMREARRFRSFADSDFPSSFVTSPEWLASAAGTAVKMMYRSRGMSLLDKEPLEPIAFPDDDVFEYLNDVRDMLDARFVFMVREPVATISSMNRRLWGYSLTDEAQLEWGMPAGPRKLDIPKHVQTWKRAARAALRSWIMNEERTRLVRYENLIERPHEVKTLMSDFMETRLADFYVKKSTAPLLNDALYTHETLREVTAWERQVLGWYDDRPFEARPTACLITGEQNVGKTTVAHETARQIGGRVVVLDGDEVRRNLWPELGWSVEDRRKAAARMTKLALRIVEMGTHVIIAMVAPEATVRDQMLSAFVKSDLPFRVVRLTASLDARERRTLEKETRDLMSYEESQASMTLDSTTTPAWALAEEVKRLFPAR